uniref:Zn(2)-C6 fungal-type domain-containing protein n=1 Tax=Bionectria ochroleuca TaxID=29856 RepID=A0A8H7TUX3_BIOOC
MASFQSTASVPQGFSVYQPMLGAPLQFFPALGTKHLDDLMDAYFPGPASIKEKRATISLDFLDHIQRTGETFKFYAVAGLVASPESPASVSTSSLNVSPVTSNWDWSSINGSSTPQTSRKASTASSRQQQPAGDFSHMPGMKIMTKEGVDVTNSASRGSKTKEQRDHAHLMRIIKACDSCRKKKVRCDPSHKKRGGASPVAAPSNAKVVKKTKVTRQEPTVAKALPMAMESVPPPAPSIDFDFSLTSDLDTFMPLDFAQQQPWEDLIQYPVEELDENYDFFFDPEGYISSGSASFSTPESQPIRHSISPNSIHENVVAGLQEAYAGTDYFGVDQHAVNATPAGDFNIPVDADYTDFNLFSPQSTFSEDDRMLSVASSTPSSSSGENTEGDLARYRGPTQSPLIYGGDGFDDVHGTMHLPSEAEQLVVGDGQDHNRLLSPSTDQGALYYRTSDHLNASAIQSASADSMLRDGHTISSSRSEQEAYATSLHSVSFADNIHSTGSEILSTPELSDSESPLSGSRGSQSPSLAGLDEFAFTGVDSVAESREITNLEAVSRRRNIVQEAAYAGDQHIVGDDKHATMHAVFAIREQSRTATSHDNSHSSVDLLQRQQLQHLTAVEANANGLKSAVAAAQAGRADQSTGQSSVPLPSVLLHQRHGLVRSKLPSPPLPSDPRVNIAFYGLALLVAQAASAWNLMIAMAIAGVVAASCLGQGWSSTRSTKHDALKASQSLLSTVTREVNASRSTNTYMHERVPLLGRQLVQAF